MHMVTAQRAGVGRHAFRRRYEMIEKRVEVKNLQGCFPMQGESGRDDVARKCVAVSRELARPLR